MVSTIRIDDDVKQMLKIKSAELGITQYELLNRYVLKGLEEDKNENKPPSIEELKQKLDYDKPEGNGLRQFAGIIKTDFPTNAVELKRNAFKR